MSHEVETMAYAGATPWHGLGEQVEDTFTPEEMGKAAGLDWTVSQHPCFAKIPMEDGTHIEVDTGKVALVRDTDKRVLTVSSANWNPLQNHQMLAYFKQFCAQGGAKMETAGSLRHGKHVWALANLGVGFELPGGDKTDGYLLFSNSHEVGKATEVRVTSVRVVCANTIAMALQGGSKSAYKQNHLTEFDLNRASEVISLARDTMVEQGNFAKKLLTVNLTRKDVMDFMNSLISDDMLTSADLELFDEDPHAMSPKMQGLMRSYSEAPGATEGNAWGVLNAVTHYVDHGARSSSADARLSSAWFGAGSNLKNAAIKKLQEMV